MEIELALLSLRQSFYKVRLVQESSQPVEQSRIPVIENQINCINEELKEVTNWFKANKLSVNASKTNYMILGTPRMVSNMDVLNVNVILDSTALEKVKHSKFLGVLIDDCLTWKNHIDCVSKTISRNIGVMNKLKHFVPTRILHVLNCTLVLPYLNYGILIWGDTCKSYLDKLIKLQKWAIRTVSIIVTTEVIQGQFLLNTMF